MELLKFLVAASVSVMGIVLERTHHEDRPYFMVDQLVERGVPEGKALRVHGWVKPGTIHRWAPEQTSFTLQANGKQIGVSYGGVLPDVFKDQAEIIVVGTTDHGAVIATELDAKCATTYDSRSKLTVKFE